MKNRIKNKINVHINELNIKLITTDIFDTILLRNTKPESFRFYEIAKLHTETLNKYGYNKNVHEVWKSRKYAMNIAYRTAKLVNYERDAKIEDIYKIMLKILDINEMELINELIKYELDYEVKNLSINKLLVSELIKIKNEKNIKIIFFSDMYFSHEHIKYLLKNKCKELEFDGGYVSSQYSMTKFGGGLYNKLLEDINLSSDNILHLGDNYISDYLGAKRKSINSIHTPRNRYFIIISKLKNKIYNFTIGR